MANQNTAVVAHFEVYQLFCCPLSEIKLNLLYVRLMSPYSRRVSLTALVFFSSSPHPLWFWQGKRFNRNILRQKAKQCECRVVLPHSQPMAMQGPRETQGFWEKCELYFGMFSILGEADPLVWLKPVGTCPKQKLCFKLSFIYFFFKAFPETQLKLKCGRGGSCLICMDQNFIKS